MKTYETNNWLFWLDDRFLRITRRDGSLFAGSGEIAIDKREFGEALVGLGIVMSAVVRHAGDEVAEPK